MTELFCRKRILTLRSVVDIAGSDLNNAGALAASLRIRSERIIKQLHGHLKHCLTGLECVLLENYCNGVTVPNADNPFHPLNVHSRFGNCIGSVVEENSCTLLNLQEVKGKTMYKVMVKCLNKNKLNECIDTPWRGHMHL